MARVGPQRHRKRTINLHHSHKAKHSISVCLSVSTIQRIQLHSFVIINVKRKAKYSSCEAIFFILHSRKSNLIKFARCMKVYKKLKVPVHDIKTCRGVEV